MNGWRVEIGGGVMIGRTRRVRPMGEEFGVLLGENGSHLLLFHAPRRLKRATIISKIHLTM